MAYKYKKTKRLVTMGTNPGEKHLAAIAQEGKIKTDGLTEFIEENSSISKEDITILFEALAVVIEENITIGRGVNFAKLGVFSPNFRTSGELSADEVTADNIKQVVVNFRPAVEFRNEIEAAKVSETNQFDLKHRES